MRSAASRRHIHSHQTVRRAVHEIRERLHRQEGSATGSSCRVSARHDAKALVANALEPRLARSNDVVFHDERKLTNHEAAKLTGFVKRRLAGEPLAYIAGSREFWSMDFAVTPDTLIPRSDSEVLIETLVEQYEPQTPLRILDIGTGSGCLLLAALSEFPRATGVGIDVSPRALEVARGNACTHNLDGRTAFVLRDLQTLPRLGKEDALVYQRFDVVLCNPPYIPRRELHLVGQDVLAYEPHLALFPDGGPLLDDTGVDPQGLRMYEYLHQSVANLFRNHSTETAVASDWDIKQSEMPAYRTTKSCLLMEIGSMNQAQAVRELFASTADRCPQRARLDGSRLQFERFLFDASGKCRGLHFA
ncbi:unnamed protein product [Hyaloperonospora brassicae]|uniref:Peptide chain release factor N(5)-glutamine methyltransferase n=1 Tax=Hyaloperonospora brassicae TaxID=162125 RepID=A0AAV0THJ5_HYABA|nr:unnamed protein product [Hyaloperonospora brassicae]